jgi:hypothetical protein
LSLISDDEKEVITMLLTVYLCGWLVTTIGALVAANWISDRRISSPLAHGSLAIVAGVLWPVLVAGLAELVAIVIVTRRRRVAIARQQDWASTEHVAPADTAPTPATEYQAAVVSAH